MLLALGHQSERQSDGCVGDVACTITWYFPFFKGLKALSTANTFNSVLTDFLGMLLDVQRQRVVREVCVGLDCT